MWQYHGNGAYIPVAWNTVHGRAPVSSYPLLALTWGHHFLNYANQ